MGDTEAPRSVTARALAIVAAFDVDHPRLTLTELSRRTGLALATTHRLTRELEDWGALDRDDQGRYGVGFRLWETGLLASVHARLREVALPTLVELRTRTGEGIQLASIVGFDAVYVERLPAQPSTPMRSRVGARIPLHATGVGKVLLAHQSDAFVTALLQQPLERHGPGTITEPATLRRALRRIVRDGFATSREEYRLGTCSVAVPVRTGDGEALAAVGVVSYELRDDLEEFVPDLRHAADEIAARLDAAGDRAFPALHEEPGDQVG